jgi:pimeloyl-ACP methyl ester carboxylesterase
MHVEVNGTRLWFVCTGTLDPVTPVAAAQEIVNALPSGVGELALLDGAGHFPWLDQPERYLPLVTSYSIARLRQ